MSDHDRPKPVRAESQIRTWLAAFVVGAIMFFALRGTSWEMFSPLGALVALAGLVGMLWLLAKGWDERTR